MTKGIWAIIAVSSVLLFSGMYAYGVAGNTTVVNIGVNPDTTFIEIEVSDPDGLARVTVVQTDGPSGGPALLCAPTFVTSVILEFEASNFPATITVEDCDRRPGDITEWAINSAGVVRCTSGSCLPGESENKGPPEETPGQSRQPFLQHELDHKGCPVGTECATSLTDCSPPRNGKLLFIDRDNDNFHDLDEPTFCRLPQ